MQRLFYVLIFLIVFISPLLSETKVINLLSEPEIIIGEWLLSETDSIINADGSVVESQWQTVSVPYKHNFQEEKYLWLRKDIEVDKILDGTPLYLIFSKHDGAFQFYFNGVHLGNVGQMPPRFYSRGIFDKIVYVPQKIIRYGSENTIAVRMYKDTGNFNFRGITLSGERYALRIQSITTLLNVTLYKVFSGILCFVALFMLFLFIKRRKNLEYLYFALGCLFFAIYFTHFFIDKPFISFVLTKALTHGIIVIGLIFYILFVSVAYHIFNNRLFHGITAATGVLLYSGMFFQRTSDGIGNWFNVLLIFLLYTIVISVTMIIKAIRRGRKNAVPILIGLLVTIPAAGFDSYYALTSATPLTYMQGIALMIFVLSMFYSLSNNLMVLYHTIEINSREIDKKRRNLERIIDQVRDSALKLGECGKVLNENVSTNSEMIEQMISYSNNLAQTIAKQYELVNNVDTAIIEITDSIAIVTDDIVTQSTCIEETSAAVNEMSANIKSIHQLTKKADEIAHQTNIVTETGYNRLAKSLTNIQRLKEQSGQIIEMVTLIDSISEKTNLLAMNAAIEAARAGHEGKGFAIVAKEVRSLAEETKAGSQQIRSLIKQIVEEIGVSVNDFEEVLQSLETVRQYSTGTEQIINEIYNAIVEEEKGTTEIVNSITELLNAIEEIKGQSLHQKDKSGSVKNAIDNLQDFTHEINQFIQMQHERNTKLHEANSAVEQVSTKNVELSDALKSVILVEDEPEEQIVPEV